MLILFILLFKNSMLEDSNSARWRICLSHGTVQICNLTTGLASEIHWMPSLKEVSLIVIGFVV